MDYAKWLEKLLKFSLFFFIIFLVSGLFITIIRFILQIHLGPLEFLIHLSSVLLLTSIVLTGILIYVSAILAILDVINNKFVPKHYKIIWPLILLIFPIAVIVYYFIRKRTG